MSRSSLLLAALAGLLGLAGCGNSSSDSTARSSGPPTVYTVNYPLAYFAERIAGNAVKVVFPAPAGIDPAFWRPSPETIVAYQGADLILLNGAGYAKWVAKVSLPLAKTVDCGAPQEDGFIRTGAGVPHTHGPGGDHSHGEQAFTLWLDPRRAIRQAEAIRNALAQRWPEHEQRFAANFASLRSDLEALDGQWAAALAPLGQQPILFSHPVYQYFEERFRLDGRSLHWEPDADPGEDGWAELDRLVTDHPAKLMIWEGEPLAEVAGKLATMEIRSIVVAPCGNRPDDGDFLDIMRRNVTALGAVAGDR